MDWQTISTAPKDGTHFLAAWPIEETQTWLETMWIPEEDGDAEGWWAVNWGHVTDGMEPLCWMPLPSPPTTTHKAGE